MEWGEGDLLVNTPSENIITTIRPARWPREHVVSKTISAQLSSIEGLVGRRITIVIMERLTEEEKSEEEADFLLTFYVVRYISFFKQFR